MALSVDKKDSLIETIMALKLMAQQATNPHEAERAAAQVTRLLLKHNLSEMEVEVAAEKAVDDMVHYKAEFQTNKGDPQPYVRIPFWKRRLAGSVATACLCRFVFTNGQKNHWSGKITPGIMHFLGRRSNVEVAKFLYKYLETSIYWLSEDEWKSMKKAGSERKGKSFWDDWYEGCVRRVDEKLSDEYKQFQETSSSSTALVLVRRKEVDQYVKEIFPVLRSTRGRYVGNLDAHQRGYKAGGKISIRKGVEKSDSSSGLLE